MTAKEQDVTISIKAKLYPDQNTIEEFKKLTTAYSEAVSYTHLSLCGTHEMPRLPETH